VPPSAWVGAYNVNISTIDGGSTPGTGKFAVSKPVAPTITSITPAAGPRNATVTYTIVGTNFEPGLTNVTFRNSTGSVLNGTVITSITSTRITGTILIPANALTGLYNVNINTLYGGSTPGTGKFAVTKLAPTITTITPATSYRNATVGFTIKGSNFEPGTTIVTFANKTGSVLNETSLISVTPAQIIGTIMVPPNASIGAYNVNISTMYGGSVPGTGKFAVAKNPTMTLTSVTPGTIYQGTTVGYAIAGTNFEPGLSAVTFNRTAYGDVATTVSSSTPTLIRGTVTIPAGTPTDKWNVIVSTADFGNVTKTAAVTVL
jgi:hypothetical protein